MPECSAQKLAHNFGSNPRVPAQFLWLEWPFSVLSHNSNNSCHTSKTSFSTEATSKRFSVLRLCDVSGCSWLSQRVETGLVVELSVHVAVRAFVVSRGALPQPSPAPFDSAPFVHAVVVATFDVIGILCLPRPYHLQGPCKRNGLQSRKSVIGLVSTETVIQLSKEQSKVRALISIQIQTHVHQNR